jgi:hypothetical protein
MQPGKPREHCGSVCLERTCGGRHPRGEKLKYACDLGDFETSDSSDVDLRFEKRSRVIRRKLMNQESARNGEYESSFRRRESAEVIGRTEVR